MATPTSSLIIEHFDGFGGNFVDSQYLAASYQTGKPHVFENTLMRVFSSQSRFFENKLVTSMTGGKANGKKTIDTEIYEWTLQGADEKVARVVENLESSNATPGINNSDVFVKLDLDYYAFPDVLLGMDNEYPLQVKEATPDGTGTIYRLSLQGDNPQAWIPASVFEAGAEFSKVWTTVPSEYNQWFGTQQVPNSFKLRSQVGAFAQNYTVTDKAWREEGRLAIEFLFTDRSGKEQKVRRFLPMYEAIMWDELYQSMEAQLIYGKKQTKDGPEGYWMKTGPGVREQLKDSWVKYFNSTLTVNLMKDYIMDIQFTRKDETERDNVGVTGTLGSIMFHDALVAISNGFLTVDTNWTRKVQSMTSTPNLAFGAQYTQYYGPEGLSIKLNKNAMYDSRKYCKRTHPQYPQYPIDSMRITFLDFGSAGKDNNIMMLEVKDTFRWGYQAGTHTPTGPVKGGAVTALKAGYQMFCEGTAGIWIKDVTRCGELIYDYEY